MVSSELDVAGAAQAAPARPKTEPSLRVDSPTGPTGIPLEALGWRYGLQSEGRLPMPNFMDFHDDLKLPSEVAGILQ